MLSQRSAAERSVRLRVAAAGIEPASACSRRHVRRPNVAAGLGNERTHQTDREAGGPVLVARQWCAGTLSAGSSSFQAGFARAGVGAEVGLGRPDKAPGAVPRL